MEKSKKIEFWVRFAIWLVSAIAPAIFIAWRYELFQKVSKISISGWFLFVGVILLGICIVVLSYVLKVQKWAYWKQVVKGVAFLLLPIGLCMYILYCARDTIDQLLQVLGCCMLCWTISIAINPLPQWTYEVSKGETADIFDLALDRHEKKKNGGSKD